MTNYINYTGMKIRTLREDKGWKAKIVFKKNGEKNNEKDNISNIV